MTVLIILFNGLIVEMFGCVQGWKKGTKSAGNANGNVAHCSKGTMAQLRHLGAESLA